MSKKLKIERIEGLAELEGKLNHIQKMDAIKNIVRANGADMQSREKAYMTAGVAYKKGYSKGTNRDNTSLAITESGMAAEVTTNTDHIGYIEYGTRYMDAEPAVKPAFDITSKRFIEDLRGLTD